MEFVNSAARWFNDLALTPIDRLAISLRLKELAIPCEAHHTKRLRVWVNNCCDAIQVWSVIQQATAPRCKLLQHLENCWESPDASNSPES